MARGTITTTLDEPYSVAVAGHYAYVASITNNRLVVFDVSDPDHPVALGSTSTYLNGPVSVYVAGRYAYVASFDNDRLAVFDVFTPTNPVALDCIGDSFSLNGARSVFVAGRYAYVVSYDSDRLVVFDVSDPSNLVILGSTGTNLDRPYSVVVAGRYAYVVSRNNDTLSVFQLNHLEAPTADIGSLHTGGLHVGENGIVGNDLTILGTLNVGTGARIDGRVALASALRLQPDAISPDILGGYSGNDVMNGVHGATIGGGGASGNVNRVTDHYGTVDGGQRNRAGDDDADLTTAPYGTIGGGQHNTASADNATVPGGDGAAADHYGQMAQASGSFATANDALLVQVQGNGESIRWVATVQTAEVSW